MPTEHLPRLEVPFGESKKVEDKLTGSPKQYIVRANKGEFLQLNLLPGTRSVLLGLTDLQTGEVLTKDVVGTGRQVPSSGDYLISVYGEPRPFSLTCWVKSPPG